MVGGDEKQLVMRVTTAFGSILVCALRCYWLHRTVRMCVLFRYPDPPPLHRELSNFCLDRVLLHFMILQFLIQCLYYENDASRCELIDFRDKDGDMCLWEWVFRTKWRLFHNTEGARL